MSAIFFIFPVCLLIFFLGFFFMIQKASAAASGGERDFSQSRSADEGGFMKRIKAMLP